MESSGSVALLLTLLSTTLAVKLAFTYQQKNLSELRKDNNSLLWAIFYVVFTTMLTYCNLHFTILDVGYHLVIQLLLGLCFLTIFFFIRRDQIGSLFMLFKKQFSYTWATIPSISSQPSDCDYLIKTINEATRSIKLIDSLFVYRASFENMIGTFYEWTMLFSDRSRSQVYGSSQPVMITLDQLIISLKNNLIEQIGLVPRLVVKKIGSFGQTIPNEIVCDVSKITRLLVAAVIRMVNLGTLAKQTIELELYNTHLQVDNRKSIHGQDASLMMYRAVALVLSDRNLAKSLNVKNWYKHIPSSNLEFIQRSKTLSGYIDPQRDIIESIIDGVYGYLEYPKNNRDAILLVLPVDIEAIAKQSNSHTQSPKKYSKPESLITLKEEADYMIMLMKFSDCICKTFKKIKAETIGGTLLLLKRRFGIKQHPSGALFYIRAVGITKIVTKWILQAPEPIYACLLYDLVRYTDLPLSYIKENYDLSVQKLVQKILAIHTHQEIESSLPKVKNYYKKAVDKDHPELFVLYIKLAERLYDLDNAEHYTHLDEVKHMAKETLTTDTKLASKYLDLNIAKALERAAKEAEAYLKKQDH